MDEETPQLLQGIKNPLPTETGDQIPNQPDNLRSLERTRRTREGGKTMGELWNSAKRTYKERADRGEPELPTGFRWIDELTDGLHKGEVWCVSGRPASGKTTLSINIARNIADSGKSVLFISLEMTGEQLVSRMFCEMTEYDHSQLRVGDFSNNFDAKDKMFMDFINSVDFEILEKGYRISDIVDMIENEYIDSKPDLICLDFVQLIDREGQDDRLALDEFMRKITELAKTHNLAILIISQLRRLPSGADVNREPDISDNRGSGMIEQLAHLVIIIYKVIEKLMGKTTEKIMIKIAKNRHGPCGEKEVLFEGKYFKFREMTYEDNLYAKD